MMNDQLPFLFFLAEKKRNRNKIVSIFCFLRFFLFCVSRSKNDKYRKKKPNNQIFDIYLPMYLAATQSTVPISCISCIWTIINIVYLLCLSLATLFIAAKTTRSMDYQESFQQSLLAGSCPNHVCMRYPISSSRDLQKCALLFISEIS